MVLVLSALVFRVFGAVVEGILSGSRRIYRRRIGYPMLQADGKEVYRALTGPSDYR